jgi:hypothetical protein
MRITPEIVGIFLFSSSEAASLELSVGKLAKSPPSVDSFEQFTRHRIDFIFVNFLGYRK